MKNRLAIYFSVLAMMFVASSCFNDESGETEYPYAYIKSFSVGDITSSYPGFTATGGDTTVVKTIAGSAYPFTINHASCEVYNADSLPYATDVSKIVVSMSIEGVASMYDENTGVFNYFTAEDSIDFTAPRIIRITSLDATYSKDYTVSVNAHKVNPDMMAWNEIAFPVGIAPEKAVEYNGCMLLFGRSSDGNPAVVSAPLGSDVVWSACQTVSLPSDVDFTTLHLFGGMLYVLAGGDMYASADMINWQAVSQGNNLVAIIGASDTDGFMWAANSENLFRTADGITFETVSALPQNFPLYGVSTSSYALSHHAGIVRYMLVGYATPEKDGTPKVWSKLSNEKLWTEYVNVNNPYPCPALDGLTVVRYDNFLYAFGGKGNAGGNEVEPFSSFYISKDNGIVWKAPEGFYQLMPDALKGCTAPFVAVADSANFIWIITADESVGAWRGIINRLGFKE